MSMISKQQFDELVANTTKYLQAHQKRIAELEARLKKLEERKKPGPKPKVQDAA